MFLEYFRTKQVRDFVIPDNQEQNQVFIGMADPSHLGKGKPSPKHEYLITVINQKGHFLISFPVYISSLVGLCIRGWRRDNTPN